MPFTESSRMFVGYRALGFASNHVPLCVRYHQKHRENYVVTCVGRAFHTYNCSKLGIKTVSNTHPDVINCLAVDARHVYSACGKEIFAYTQGKKIVYTYRGHADNVHLLLPFADHLISVDERSCVKIWNIEAEDVYLEIIFNNETFNVSTVVHPHTYINKILFGSKQGCLQLWNIRRNELIYSFTGWSSPVTVLEQSPAMDVVAVGLADGRIILHNLKFDETLVSFKQDWGAVISLSFRTDGRPIMVSGSPIGHIAVWNLEDRKLQSQIRSAHSGPVTGMKCLASEPLMITSGPDNALKLWIFDQPDGGGRLLNQRSGHSQPPNKIRFHGTDGQLILSAGQDSTLRVFSSRHESQDKSLGRASFNKAKSKKAGLLLDEHMMPPIIDFHSETARQSDWDGILACHRGVMMCTTWNFIRSTMGAHRLRHPRFKDKKMYKNIVPLCVTVTSCGNFGLIGYSSGHVDVYNMQSGQHRGSYGQDRAHSGSVLSLSVDALNRQTITAGADSCIKFWKFKCSKSKEPIETINIDSVIARSTMHRESYMLALALDDCRIMIVDVETRRIVRKLAGHSNNVTDMAFSSDGRWLFSASMDSTIKTWDVPSGRLIDCFLVELPVTSLSMSPTGTFLTTTHVDDLGIYLWANMTLYTSVAFKPLPADYQPRLLNLPSTSQRQEGTESNSKEDGDDDEDGHADDVNSYKSPEQISSELVTLSLLPNSRWLSLIHLDVIKQRNKPKVPPKAVAVPFFIPTIPGLEPKFDISTDKDGDQDASAKIRFSSLRSLSEFGRLLMDTETTKTYDAVMARLKATGPSGTDVEVRGLSPEGGGSIELMICFMDFLVDTFDKRKDFELAQGYLGLFLKLHGDLISLDARLLEKACELQSSQMRAWSLVRDKLNQSSCLVNYLRSALL